MKEQVYRAIAGSCYGIYLDDLAATTGLSAATLLSIVEQLRREWRVSCTAVEGRARRQSAVTTADGCGRVEVRE